MLVGVDVVVGVLVDVGVVVVVELLHVTVKVTLPVDGVTVTDCGLIWHDSPLGALTILPANVADDTDDEYVNVFPVLVPEPDRLVAPGTPSIVADGLVLTCHTTLDGA